MRVYVPSTLQALAALLRAGEIRPPVRAFAVTPALREWYASGDEEELEYSAMTQAAGQSLRLLAQNPAAPRLRVVLAAEVPAQAVRAAGAGDDLDHPADVLVEAVIPVSRVVSAHVDEAAAEPDIQAAAEAVAAADAGDDDAQFTVDGAEGHELLWYEASELPHLFA